MSQFCDNEAVKVIDTATNKVMATIPVGSHPNGLALAPDGTRAYVTNFYDNTFLAIDTATNKVVATIPVGFEPYSIAVTPDGKYAYVTVLYTGAVSVIDIAANQVAATIPVGRSPIDVGIVPPSAGTPFSAFKAKLEIDLDHKAN